MIYTATAKNLTDAAIEALRREYATPFQRTRRAQRLIVTCDTALLPSSGFLRRTAARERVAAILNARNTAGGAT